MKNLGIHRVWGEDELDDDDDDDDDEDEDNDIINEITAESIINSDNSVVLLGALITVNENEVLNADITYRPIVIADKSECIVVTQNPTTIATEPIAAYGMTIDYDNSFSITDVALTHYRMNSVR